MPGKLIEGRSLKTQEWTLMPDSWVAASGAAGACCADVFELP